MSTAEQDRQRFILRKRAQDNLRALMDRRHVHGVERPMRPDDENQRPRALSDPDDAPPDVVDEMASLMDFGTRGIPEEP